MEVDKGDERLAKQIRNAEQARVPLMAVVGAEEMAQNTLAIRSRKGNANTVTLARQRALFDTGFA